MANITRIKTVWSNFPGAPGYSSFYYNGAEDPTVASGAAGVVHDFWNAIKGLVPVGLQWQIQGVADIIDPATGHIVDQISITQPPFVQATANGTYSGTSGGLVDWLTTVYRGGRRVRGRTYIVPLGANTYGDDGSLIAATVNTLQTAANDFLAGTDGANVVYSRPTPAHPVGTASQITAATVPDLAVVMRSRRT